MQGVVDGAEEAVVECRAECVHARSSLGRLGISSISLDFGDNGAALEALV